MEFPILALMAWTPYQPSSACYPGFPTNSCCSLLTRKYSSTRRSQGSLVRGWRRELILNPPIPPTGSCPFPALGCVKGWFEVLWPRTFEGLGAFGLSDLAELLQVRLWRVTAEPQGGFLLGCPIPYPHRRTRRESETVRAGDKALGWVLPCGDQTVSSQPHLDSCVSSQSNFQPQRTPRPPPERLAQVR